MTLNIHEPQLSADGRATLEQVAADARISNVHILAWRDLADPNAGGSELHVSTIAALWAQAGIDVTIRTSHTRGLASVAYRDGYRVIRRASRYGVFFRASAAEFRGRDGEADALIEIWNGMPFLSPLWWRKKPHNVWLHHVHASMWTMMLGKIGHLGILLEERIAPRFYRGVQMVTLSRSSQDELVDLGFERNRVAIVPPGIDPVFSPGGTKAAHPKVVAVGRLAPVKRFHLLVDVIAELRERIPDIELVIVGDGPRREALEAQIQALGAEGYVTLAGRVSEEELIDHYRSAWVLSSASEREGWGMTITEAAACGTPAVVTRISGHSDAVVEGRTGLLASDMSELAKDLERVLTDDLLRSTLSEASLAHAQSFTWEATALATFELLASSR
jgi:glycosyltransferase involved in cell wall biosynthesis